MSAVADVLNGAADLIERDGFVQRMFSDHRGRRCMDGAIMTTCLPGRWQDRQAAREVLVAVVGADLYDWNDEPGRTQAEVVAALRAAAERA